MEANEAIEIMEELLKEFREESENGLTLESEKEALSIVLESAKLLHEVLEAPTTEVIEEGIIKCFVNGSITIDKKTQKDIGIDEGAIK